MPAEIEIHAEFPNKAATNDFAIEYRVEFGHELYDINGCVVKFFVHSERGAAAMIAFIENLGGHIVTVNELDD